MSPWSIRVACLIGLLAAAAPSHGKHLETHGQESLLYLAEVVVEGRLKPGVDVQRPADKGAAIVVSAVHVGALEVGQTILVGGLDGYRLPIDDRDPWRHRLLTADDRVVLYLVPDGNGVWMPVPSGVQVVRDQQLVGFMQQDNPGPYVMTENAVGSGPREPTLSQTPTRWRAAQELKRKLHDPATLTAWIVDALRQRREAGGVRADAIVADLCSALADRRDHEAIVDLLPMMRGYRERFVLNRGMATKDGRRKLLEMLAGDQTPDIDRLVYAQALGDTWRPDEPADEQATVARRAAQLAAERSHDVPLAQTLVAVVGRRQEAGNAGEALAMLRELRNRDVPQPLKHHIDAIDPQVPFTLLVHRVEHERGRLAFHTDYSFKRTVAKAAGATVVIRDGAGRQRAALEITAPHNLTRWTGGGFGTSIPVNVDLPAGRYRAVLRITLDGTPVDSYWAEFEW